MTISPSNDLATPVDLATSEDVTAVLRAVIDPELGSDIVDLGMVKNVAVTPQGVAKITIALTTMGCPCGLRSNKMPPKGWELCGE